jgi:hypothetical protein
MPLADRWEWLWKDVSYSVEEWRDTAGVGRNAKKLISILKGNRVIFPDGTAGRLAVRVAQQYLAVRLQDVGVILPKKEAEVD